MDMKGKTVLITGSTDGVGRSSLANWQSRAHTC
jgi:NAD(P)-dependent dehydrogenase (short-subunit alcohol dehydrogenase family)